ncbi:hypothetical protein [Deinococcus sp.]
MSATELLALLRRHGGCEDRVVAGPGSAQAYLLTASGRGRWGRAAGRAS